MTTPANMPKKTTPKAPQPEERVAKPEQPKVTNSSPVKQTMIKVATASNGSHGDVRINGNSLPADLVPHIDIEMESDGSGVVWVGLIADRITVASAASSRRKR
ncbi:hypothetical protein YH66_05170 [[Brevibacterium] flavum]|uniref:Uncharacterized protein n=1 Tax=[Brevibacterium] flavum TaxID=92706 RepID=A0A0F6SQX9_9CORY|nr:MULTISPECIES: hypothetical protein [Corynebacterium]AKF26989.1 hypothetical protein YH66_05170 [[Brevibacterium] flavum]ANE07811.1 hypothetical protein A3654_05160 [Corynebacterium glutamicum]AST20227.1 hypothetical protein CEY17_05225 [Corynebacterium glutamicum ATCC 14067]KEI22701.1 hypothetical protein KIQ_009000 [Corynebacterium glutamicum ATCC 14067]KIH74246.1 hypothetical protein SD36_05195 [Corynebacterium glutamicum]